MYRDDLVRYLQFCADVLIVWLNTGEFPATLSCPYPPFTKQRWTGCSRDWTNACKPTMSWSTSPRQCWYRHHHRRRAGCWAGGPRCSYAWMTRNKTVSQTLNTCVSHWLCLFLVFHLISLRRAFSWLCSCSFASCCSSRSLCNFFLLCSSLSISSSASSICLFKAFRRRFSFKDKQHKWGYKGSTRIQMCMNHLWMTQLQ